MYGWRGVLTGALALIVLSAVVSSNAAADNVGGALGVANEIAKRFIDPKVPAIPARTHAPLAPIAGATFPAAAGGATPNAGLNVYGLPLGTAPPPGTPVPPAVGNELGRTPF